MSRVLELLRMVELGASVSEISSSLKIDRKTVRKYRDIAGAKDVSWSLAKGLSDIELKQLFEISEAGVGSRAELDYEYLIIELHKPNVTKQLLHQEYITKTPDGVSYSQFCALLRREQKSRKLSYRHEYPAGKWFQVDYAGSTVPIYTAGSAEPILKAQIFVGTLCCSNLIFAEATESQKLACWIGSHSNAMRFLGGVPEAIGLDNLKSGVKTPCNYDPETNRSYAEWATHYEVTVVPVRKHQPRDKAKVESAVRLVQNQVIAPLRKQRFYSIAELNAAMLPLLEAVNNRVMKDYGKSRRELFEELEQSHLKPLPQDSFELSYWKRAKVHVDYHVQIAGNYYSVPFRYAREMVEARYTTGSIEIFHRNKRIALHQRLWGKRQWRTEKEHMPPAHRYYASWGPKRFLSWAATIGDETAIQVNSVLLSHKIPEQAYRKCIGLITSAKKYGAERVEQACKKANRLGIVSTGSIARMLKAGLETEELEGAKELPQLHANIRGDLAFH
jgi:transposase